MQKVFEKIIERMEEETDCPNCSMYCADANMCGFDEMSKQAIEIVNQAAEEYGQGLVEDSPSLVQGWVSVNERLPELNDYPEQNNRVLASYDDGIVRNATIKSLYGERHYKFGQLITPIAWKPLPAPYQPKENSEIPNNSINDTWKQQTMSRFERVE